MCHNATEPAGITSMCHYNDLLQPPISRSTRLLNTSGRLTSLHSKLLDDLDALKHCTRRTSPTSISRRCHRFEFLQCLWTMVYQVRPCAQVLCCKCHTCFRGSKLVLGYFFFDLQQENLKTSEDILFTLLIQILTIWMHCTRRASQVVDQLKMSSLLIPTLLVNNGVLTKALCTIVVL